MDYGRYKKKPGVNTRIDLRGDNAPGAMKERQAREGA
jgi:hypothetical protein